MYRMSTPFCYAKPMQKLQFDSRTHILSQIKNVLMYFVVRCQIQSDRCLDEENYAIWTDVGMK